MRENFLSREQKQRVPFYCEFASCRGKRAIKVSFMALSTVTTTARTLVSSQNPAPFGLSKDSYLLSSGSSRHWCQGFNASKSVKVGSTQQTPNLSLFCCDLPRRRRCCNLVSGSRHLRRRTRTYAVEEETAAPPSAASTQKLKDFLQDLKDVGRVRIIVNTGVAVLESVTNLDKLFYHTLPGRGEFANVMTKEDNVDFHLLIDQVSAAKLVKGKSARGDIPTYMIRFVDGNGSVAVSLLVMWRVGTDGDYDHGQVEAFESLLEKYGPEIQFSS